MPCFNVTLYYVFIISNSDDSDVVMIDSKESSPQHSSASPCGQDHFESLPVPVLSQATHTSGLDLQNDSTMSTTTSQVSSYVKGFDIPPQAAFLEYPSSPSYEQCQADLSKLHSIFSSNFTSSQIAAIFELSDSTFESAMNCLLSGPNITNMSWN